MTNKRRPLRLAAGVLYAGLFALATSGLACPASVGSPAEPKGEWWQLFDGKSLDGWEHVGPGSFVVENGTLRTEGGMGLLWYTRETFGDCVLRVVYKTTNE